MSVSLYKVYVSLENSKISYLFLSVAAMIIHPYKLKIPPDMLLLPVLINYYYVNSCLLWLNNGLKHQS